ncbi:related to Cutinase transcription factor 1 alpha [Cephalotrichum gorgonifer]|uniref:Related to Cutinase transcription factor 1 alpha n=1 Tax=Cephalotrichum gorgonifer TaxID=2041049 RepID=A0AAE8MYW7_9PEZI|nr:related to Cutinase transcription factor 1 alpha [Cephalotrichum gorgonifer]
MSNDPSGRRILPQSAQMGTFAFAPQQAPQTQKNYVFVDEHNRHKRLKVMRACEGCRRRKIKCDAATTNTWPCSACQRLKLNCVRPNGFDGSETPTMTSATISDASATSVTPSPNPDVSPMYDSSGRVFASPSGVQDPFAAQSMMHNTAKTAAPMYQSSHFAAGPPDLFQTAQYEDARPPAQHNMSYTGAPQSVNVAEGPYAPHNVFPPAPLQGDTQQGSSPGTYSQDSYQTDLADLLGSLKVNEAGTAPYLRSKASFRREEEPAVEEEEEFKIQVPPMTPGRIRIPPALMPDDETAHQYFNLYFTSVHPFLPVLSKTLFYQQWNTNRSSISPLILEAIFAIGGRLADEPAQGQQWLAMGTAHADSFMDVPRLSTLQALLIMLKAREGAPKKGYYYRSWMSVVQCVQMGKDLGLDEHYEDHQAGRGCESSELECRMNTRIWQTIFTLEVMIGSPQGRTDLAVGIDEVDFRIPQPVQGDDNEEYLVTRNFTYLARLVRNISRMNSVYARIKKKKDWGIDPEFVQLNPSLNSWLAELPADLTITFPPGTSPPWIPSAFVGNLHTYHYLSFILLHRPQLAFCDPAGADGKWRQHMMICYSSAKAICRLQEAVMDTFGLDGLGNMLRGFSFPVYCALSCVVLHLVAMTSPDPELNADSREFFQRQMRLVERVMAGWPMPELQKQINAVRDAFSADVRKPFTLKPSFPYGSPASSASTPPRSSPGYRAMANTGAQLAFTSQSRTPPITTGSIDGKVTQPMAIFAAGQGDQAAMMGHQIPMSEPPAWNPSRIFENWNTSFGEPQVQQNNAAGLKASSSSPPDMSGYSKMQPAEEGVSPDGQAMLGRPYPAPIPTFITPAMWQESVASVYEVGMKRAWAYDGGSSKRHQA